MRTNFWKGILACGIIGAAISMMAGVRHRQERKNILGFSSRQARSRAHRVLRGVTKTVNDMIK